jgi:dTDP-4-amino-4,6-dideoxygalactose transaminase
MAVAFFDITRQNKALKKELNEAVKRVISSGHFILGENVVALEKEITAYCGVKYALGVASGTDALHLALRACGIKEGDEVVTSPFSFVATAEAVSCCGATPVFVDIEPKTFNIDPAKIKNHLTSKTRAILVVHLFGQTCEMDKILAVAKEHNLKVVEDCAQAIGAEFRGRKAGSMGDAGCFSFFPTKNLGCFGDGGMVVTNNEQTAERVKILRNHGSRKTYHYDTIGYNSRLDEIQAAILRVKLPRLESYVEKRRKNAAYYRQRLKAFPQIAFPLESSGNRHTYNQFTVRVKNRNRVFKYLKGRGIGSMAYYPLSLHLQKAFSGLKYNDGSFPESEKAQEEVLSLPIYPELTEKEAKTVADTLRECLKA